jgi:hypothetical protein
MGVGFSVFTVGWNEDHFASLIYFSLPMLMFITATLVSGIDDCVRQARIQTLKGRRADHSYQDTAVRMRGEWVDKVTKVSSSVAELAAGTGAGAGPGNAFNIA